MSVQMNVRTTPVLLREIDVVVKDGYFRNRTEAVNEALRILIRRYKLLKIEERMANIRTGTEGLPSAAEEIIKSHEEEDER